MPFRGLSRPGNLNILISGLSRVCTNPVKLESMRYIFAVDSIVYLHSNLCGGLYSQMYKTTECLTATLESSKLVSFDINWKHVWNFPLVINSNLTRSNVHHMATSKAENRNFSQPPLNKCLCLDETYLTKTCLAAIDQWRPGDPSLHYFDIISECDRWTSWW